MKTLLTIFVLLFSSSVVGDEVVIPSIDKIFKEKNIKYLRSGTLFYGCIFSISYGKEDLFTQKRKILSVQVGTPDAWAMLYVKEFEAISKEDSNAPQIDDCFAFISNGNSAESEILYGQYDIKILLNAELFSSNYTVEETVIKKILKNNITIDEYFDEGIYYGQKRINLTGEVEKIVIASDGNLRIVLVSTQGKTIDSWYFRRDWENSDLIKNKLRSIQVGDIITLKGYFDMEMLSFSSFIIQKILD